MAPAAPSRPAVQRAAAGALAACGLVVAPAADAASSASHQISGAVVDAAGGTSTSANHTLTACVGSEIAGASASASHRIESGCGPSALALASDFPLAGVPGGPREIPTMSEFALALLVVALATLAARRLRPPRR